MNNNEFLDNLNQTNDHLDLQYHELSFEQVKILANFLKNNKTIKEINLRHNRINDAGVAELAEVLKVNVTLEKLYLSSNEIGNEGAKHLADALKINTALKILHLSFNNINAIGFAELTTALTSNMTLEKCCFFEADPNLKTKMDKETGFNRQIKHILQKNYFSSVQVCNAIFKIIQQKPQLEKCSSLYELALNKIKKSVECPSLLEMAFNAASNMVVDEKISADKARTSLPTELLQPLMYSVESKKNKLYFSRLSLFNPLQEHLTGKGVDSTTLREKSPLTYKIECN